MTVVLLSLMAAMLWGATGVLTRKGTERVDPMVGSFISTCVGFSVLLLITLFAFRGEPPRAGASELFLLAAAGIMNYLIARSLNYVSIMMIGPSQAMPIMSAQVLVAPVFALVALREALTPQLSAGIVLVFLGAYFLASK